MLLVSDCEVYTADASAAAVLLLDFMDDALDSDVLYHLTLVSDQLYVSLTYTWSEH
jgi:hypothetical protein